MGISWVYGSFISRRGWQRMAGLEEAEGSKSRRVGTESEKVQDGSVVWMFGQLLIPL